MLHHVRHLTEGVHHGQLIDDPDEFKRYSRACDRLRAEALPPLMSLDMIRSVLEDNRRGSNLPSLSEWRRLEKEQLQQSGGRNCVEVATGLQDPSSEAAAWADFIGELKADDHRQ